MKYTIHKRSEQEVVGSFDHKADAVHAITGIIDGHKAVGEWQDGDYMTIRSDGHILSYIPAQRVTADEFGNTFTSPDQPGESLRDYALRHPGTGIHEAAVEHSVVETLAAHGKADIKVLEAETKEDPIVVTAAIQRLVKNGTAIQFTGTNEAGNSIPVWRLA